MCVDEDDVRDEYGASRQVGRRGEASGHDGGELSATGVFGRLREREPERWGEAREAGEWARGARRRGTPLSILGFRMGAMVAGGELFRSGEAALGPAVRPVVAGGSGGAG